MWKHCLDKLQPEIFYVFGNFKRENNNLKYSIEGILKGSLRTHNVGIYHPHKQKLWRGWSAVWILISFLGDSDVPKVQDPLLGNDAPIIAL